MTLSTAPFESTMRISPPRKQAWPSAISNIVDHAKFYSRSHDAVIRVYDAAGNVIETHEHISRLLNLALSGLLISMCRQPQKRVSTKADNTQTGPIELR
jgi:intracellular sulfur oxidation DsrE/DsrF family protein